MNSDDYLEFCEERNESPEKPYSGKFMVRLEPELHKRLAIMAKKKHKSLNSLVYETLAHATEYNEKYSPNPRQNTLKPV